MSALNWKWQQHDQCYIPTGGKEKRHTFSIYLTIAVVMVTGQIYTCLKNGRNVL